MVELKCKNYGFECDFIADGEIDVVVDKFRTHNEEEHGIDYSREAVMQFLLRKQKQ